MPAKKRKTGPQADVKAGISRSYLQEHFSVLPPVSADLLNGHVLHSFNLSHGSRKETAAKLITLFPEKLGGDHSYKQEVERFLKNGVKRTVEGFSKFKKLRDPVEMKNFEEKCREKFQSSKSPAPILDDPVDEPAVVVDPAAVPSETTHLSVPAPQISLLKTRKLAKCGQCKILRKTSQNLRKTILELKRQKVINHKLSATKRYAISRLHQKVKRKEQQIKNLQTSDLALDLKSTKQELGSLQRKHQRAKRYHRSCKKKLFSPGPSSYESELAELQTEVCYLQSENLELEATVREMQENTVVTKTDKKTYSPQTRMMVFDAITSQTPIAQIPRVIKNISSRCGVTLKDIPTRWTVEAMARELGTISDLQTAELLIKHEHSTIGFDATTQDRCHVNEIHFNTISGTLSAAVDELPGGTAVDYHSHICETVDQLAAIYAHFNQDDQYDDVREKLISNISNSLTDRCAANHATIQLLNETWDTNIHELNCHLHPLDSIASKTRSAIKMYEKDKRVPKKIFGTDCVVADIVVQINKLRYKDVKGDPKGFVTFLTKKKLPRGILPRYRGNRLHIMFHICGVLFEHYTLFEEYLKTGPALGGLRACV
ncbi:hypothetical protein SNE40_005122 [Patella caerulea]|uniref:Uncharacterized protein n=1 Tax=Patella caerulea TaxID=87958 RepID=A0AAN8K4H9_PATCE